MEPVQQAPNAPIKNPSSNKKALLWVLIIIIVVVVLGVLIKLVLNKTQSSLQLARLKSQDAWAEMQVSNVMADAVNSVPDGAKKPYAGFVLPASAMFYPCNGTPTINISPDAKQMAIFVQSCVTPESYFCDDTNLSLATTVTAQYAKSGASLCSTGETPIQN